MFQVDSRGKLLDFHEGKYTDFRPFAAELRGKPIYVLSDEKRVLQNAYRPGHGVCKTRPRYR